MSDQRNDAGGLKAPPPGGYEREHADTFGVGTLKPMLPIEIEPGPLFALNAPKRSKHGKAA